MRIRLKKTPWIAAAIALVLVFGVVGCDDLVEDEGEASTSTSETAGTTSTDATISSATTTTASASTTTTVPIAAFEELLPSGNIKAHGFITNVWMDGSVRMLEIDFIEYYTGAEAVAEATIDGDPDAATIGWYWRDDPTPLQTYIVSDTVTITTYSRDSDIVAPDSPCTWAKFLSFWGSAGPLPFADSQLHLGKWFIERDGDVVVHIEEVWTP